MENKPINMQKIDEIVAKGSSTVSHKVNIHSDFKSRVYNFFHKKNVLIVCFLIIVLGICLFIFKDILFRNKSNENIKPKTYQEIIDQSFKDGYKTDYTYKTDVLENIAKDTEKASQSKKTTKTKTMTDAEQKAFLEKINR